ncbi:FAD-dependent oxidoreductase [Pontiella agarivorans]|uniref:FAD-dependent oxidoreductase n=1 Tax=Pontiella agarivorans TaxID=3038953 RepID=A0ABU5MWU8_9BACT|nr:FAD-dependent oxidoreductase [Pontiella agarivorans]MDZ8118436.1 FAD-dependent oxidoreductase [Pontiella agarivorans]
MKKTVLTLCASLGWSAMLSAAAEKPLANWRFDDGVGNTVADSSGHGNSGKIGEIKWVMGAVNSAGQLGYQAGVQIAHDPSLLPDKSFSVQAWIKPWAPKYDQHPNIVRKNGSYVFKLAPSKSLALVLWLNGEKKTFESKHKEWPNGKWQHVAATYDGKKVCLYVNGGLDSTFPASGIISGSASDCFIGAQNKQFFFNGTLDEVRLDGVALSSRDIAESSYKGRLEMARRDNRFTDFYEKIQKRSGETQVPGTLWIDAEDFSDYGGWWMDTQFVPQMGSPFLMAAGIGTPVENAKTTIKVPESGTYRLWVRNKNWYGNRYAPGQFAVSINGKKSETTFGTREQRAWVWQDGGTFELKKGETALELEDLTGWYGRCDALLLTKDLEFYPKQEQKDYLPMREKFVGTIPVKDAGHFDFIVVGGGVAGCNAAIAAARGGAKVALIQDRPMVGGNNSAEMGVPVSGGSSLGKGRETGLNEEIGRIHSYNFLSKWATGAERVIADEPNITLFLNEHVFEAETDKDNHIKAVKSFDMIDGQHTRYTADLFADCTGDGWLGYYAGADWMLGRESKEQFGEMNAKDIADNVTMSGSLMQNSILGYQAIDTGKPYTFEGEDWFYDLRMNEEGYVNQRPRYESGIRAGNWWTENHGRNDDLWDPEWTRDDLILVSLSYYHWIKNYSPLAEKAKNYQLRYIPVTNAKRETRRLVGDVIVTEHDILNRKVFPDRVGYFVWKLDVHHPLGIFSPGSPYDYENNISPASIPMRMLYSKDVPNLFMAGRHVSVTHVALGSARVQGTTGMMGQAVGAAAAMCLNYETTPRGIVQNHMSELQQQLLKDDVTIPHLRNEDPDDLALMANVKASSHKSLEDGVQNVINGLTRPMDENMEMWIGKVPNNMWISDPKQAMPQWVELDFGGKKKVNSVYLTFDTNLKVKRYTSWEQKPEERMPPECVRDYQVQVQKNGKWETVADVTNNYQRRRVHHFQTLETSKVRILITATNGDHSARIYEIRAYNE